MHGATITGVKDFLSTGSRVAVNGGNIDLFFNIQSPKVTLSTEHYEMTGTLTDHINLEGMGPAM